jgi:putative endonuclease
VERNYRCKVGELDLIARHGDLLVFVEVKSRHHESFGAPAEFVHRKKQQKLVRTAELYLKRFERKPPACRFDVIEVRWDPAGRPLVNHLPDAFRPEHP